MLFKHLCQMKAFIKNLYICINFFGSNCLPALKILKDEFALERSMKEGMRVDKDGQPIPWYTYPAIEYLKQFNFSDKRVYEFGCGNSSLFWASRARNVVAVEEDETWYRSRLSFSLSNLRLKFRKEGKEYYESILEEDGYFDVVVIDGNSNRDLCSVSTLQRLHPKGIVILDNSDRSVELEEYQNAIKVLRNAGLIQVDFYGFCPMVNFTTTTSIFFSRQFDSFSNNNFQINKGIGSIKEKV